MCAVGFGKEKTAIAYPKGRERTVKPSAKNAMPTPTTTAAPTDSIQASNTSLAPSTGVSSQPSERLQTSANATAERGRPGDLQPEDVQPEDEVNRSPMPGKTAQLPPKTETGIEWEDDGLVMLDFLAVR